MSAPADESSPRRASLGVLPAVFTMQASPGGLDHRLVHLRQCQHPIHAKSLTETITNLLAVDHPVIEAIARHRLEGHVAAVCRPAFLRAPCSPWRAGGPPAAPAADATTCTSFPAGRHDRERSYCERLSCEYPVQSWPLGPSDSTSTDRAPDPSGVHPQFDGCGTPVEANCAGKASVGVFVRPGCTSHRARPGSKNPCHRRTAPACIAPSSRNRSRRQSLCLFCLACLGSTPGKGGEPRSRRRGEPRTVLAFGCCELNEPTLTAGGIVGRVSELADAQDLKSVARQLSIFRDFPA